MNNTKKYPEYKKLIPLLTHLKKKKNRRKNLLGSLIWKGLFETQIFLFI